MKSPVVLLLESLFDDLNRLHPDEDGLDRDVISVLQRFENEGLSFLSKTLPTLRLAIDNGLSSGKFTCPRNFKTVPRGSIPRLFSGMIRKVFDASSGVLKDDACLASVVSLRQITSLFKKVVVDSESDDELDKESFDNFLSTDLSNSLGHMTDAALVDAVDRVSKFILPDLSQGLGELDCKHGPGAVYEGYKGNQKWEVLTKTVIERTAMERYGYSDFGKFGSQLSSSCSPPKSDDQFDLFFDKQGTFSDSVRFVSVPKDSSSRRGITVEPLLKQFIQQGLNAALRDSILKCGILSQCLTLTDQGENQTLARVGSLTGEFDTIDLKSASDLLSQEVVRLVFSKEPVFTDLLFGARSTHVDTPRGNVCLRKFAGMGNATTFPVQSVVFAVISIATIMIAENQRFSYRNVQRVAKSVRVFGDDIIVKHRYSHQVVSSLESVGLIVNRNKSFLEGNFKESCGTDWFKGVEVTPVYLKYLAGSFQKETRAISNFVSASNQLWLNCYYKLSTTMSNMVENFLKGKLPIQSEWSSALCLITRNNAIESKRYDSNLHRWLVRAPVIQSIRRKDPLDGYAALMKFFHLPIEGREEGHLERSTIRYRTRIVWKWVPAS